MTQNTDDPNSPVKMAYRGGFLFGFYDEQGPRSPDELKESNPYPGGTEEHQSWIDGYYSNL